MVKCVWRQQAKIFITCCLSSLPAGHPQNMLLGSCPWVGSLASVCTETERGPALSSSVEPLCWMGSSLLNSLTLAFLTEHSGFSACFWPLWCWRPTGFLSLTYQTSASPFGCQLCSDYSHPLPFLQPEVENLCSPRPMELKCQEKLKSSKRKAVYKGGSSHKTQKRCSPEGIVTK